MSLVSVIIPAYNREKTIKAAVESVLDQTYTNLELLVVDDCSTDGTVQVVKEIQDPRVRIILCEKNGGACAARNIGIENAKGEYIAFQDSDDIWHKDKLEKSLYYLEKEKADFVFCALNRTDTEGNTYVVPRYNMNKQEDKLEKILGMNCVSTQTILVRREVFDQVRFDERFPRFQDWELSIQVIKNGNKTYFIEEALVDSEILEDSISSNYKKGIQALSLLEKKHKDCFEMKPKGYGEFCANVGYFYEKSGLNGSDYYLKAFWKNPTIISFGRYVVSKVRLFRIWLKIFEK